MRHLKLIIGLALVLGASAQAQEGQTTFRELASTDGPGKNSHCAPVSQASSGKIYLVNGQYVDEHGNPVVRVGQ